MVNRANTKTSGIVQARMRSRCPPLSFSCGSIVILSCLSGLADGGEPGPAVLARCYLEARGGEASWAAVAVDKSWAFSCDCALPRSTRVRCKFAPDSVFTALWAAIVASAFSIGAAAVKMPAYLRYERTSAGISVTISGMVSGFIGFGYPLLDHSAAVAHGTSSAPVMVIS